MLGPNRSPIDSLGKDRNAPAEIFQAVAVNTHPDWLSPMTSYDRQPITAIGAKARHALSRGMRRKVGDFWDCFELPLLHETYFKYFDLIH